MIVYTAIFDRYDKLFEPCEVNDKIEYICFTDDTELESENWNVKIFERDDMGPAEMNRLLKLFPHNFLEDYESEFSLYVDGNIQIRSDLDKILDHMEQKSPIAAPAHPERSTIAEEATRLIELDKADSNQVRSQIERYEYQGYTDQLPLTDNCVLLRRHSDPKVQKAMDDWWEEYKSGVNRDQIGFGYTLWKNNIDLHILDFTPEYYFIPKSNERFRLHPHCPDGIYQALWPALVDIRGTCSTSLYHRLLYVIVTVLLSIKIKGITKTYQMNKSRLDKIWTESKIYEFKN